MGRERLETRRRGKRGMGRKEMDGEQAGKEVVKRIVEL